uniref:Uncharacterized protein n=1 Tax=viral metagenome TaxID=1070528 RepID=A0A6M3IWJ8_9ZZZZ
MEDKLRTAANQAARSKRVEESLTDEQVKEEVAEILYEISGGDFDFDIEGGCFPVKDFCSEYAAQIHSLYTARGKDLIERAKAEEREFAVKTINDEPEFPGEMPDEFWDEIGKEDDLRTAIQRIMQNTVRLTKEEIIKRLKEGK